MPGNIEAISASLLRTFLEAQRYRLYFLRAHFTRNGLICCSRNLINLDL